MHHLRLVSFTIVALTAPLASLAAQLCYGTPSNGGLAFEHGKMNFGTTNGVSGAIAGKHVALGGGYRSMEIGPSVTGTNAGGRFAVVLGSSRLQVCPGLGVEYERQEWNRGTFGTANSRQLIGRAGIGFGLEQPVYEGVSVIPFAVIQYAFRAVDYTVDAPDSDVQESGDTTSTGDLEYGLLARYKFVYGGFAARHAMKSAPPYVARWIIGVTFSAGPVARREEKVRK